MPQIRRRIPESHIKLPIDNYNVECMLKRMVRRHKVLLCGTCMDVRAVSKRSRFLKALAADGIQSICRQK
jgi:hypothetical protein